MPEEEEEARKPRKRRSADEVAFGTALNRAYDAAHHNLLERVRSRIAQAAPLLALGQNTETPVTASH